MSVHFKNASVSKNTFKQVTVSTHVVKHTGSSVIPTIHAHLVTQLYIAKHFLLESPLKVSWRPIH